MVKLNIFQQNLRTGHETSWIGIDEVFTSRYNNSDFKETTSSSDKICKVIRVSLDGHASRTVMRL